MLAESRLLNQLSQCLFATDGQHYVFTGIQHTLLRVHLQGPIKGTAVTTVEEEFNKSMSQVRVSVKWIFETF